MDIRQEIIKNSGTLKEEESVVEKALHDKDTEQIFAEVDEIVANHKKVIEALAK